MKKTLFAAAMLVVSAGAFAAGDAGTVESNQLSMLHNDLQVISAQLGQQSGKQDPHMYCYFNDKAYSVGAKRDDQVCVKVGNEALKPDGTLDRDKSDPLRWISAKDAARGNY